MECKRKSVRRESDRVVIEVFHDIKKIIPMLDYFLITDPRPYEEIVAHHQKIVDALGAMSQKELQLFGGKRGTRKGDR